KDQRTISGLAVVWAPSRSSDLGGWQEEIASTAFDKNLASNPDVVALFNHNMDMPLARTTSGTLRLTKTRRGLAYEFDAGDQTYSTNLVTSLERGDVHQSSFGFYCTDDSWREENGVIVRTVLEAQLFDVSPVTFPAYPDATSQVRAALRSCPLDLRGKLKLRSEDDDICDGLDTDDPRYDELDCDERSKRDDGASVEESRCACQGIRCDRCAAGEHTRCERDCPLDDDADTDDGERNKLLADLLLRRL
ncbi:MAG: HK97 family phage prohead protease, partial [Thermoplasmata archaeon]